MQWAITKEVHMSSDNKVSQLLSSMHMTLTRFFQELASDAPPPLPVGEGVGHRGGLGTGHGGGGGMCSTED